MVQYLILKVSIVVWNTKLGMGIVELSQTPDPYEKWSFYFIQSLVCGFIMLLFVHTKKTVMIRINLKMSVISQKFTP